jgi:hypothetical protein
MMRTTIDLPADLHSVLQSLAVSNRSSLSHTAVLLMRRGLELPLRDDAHAGVTLQTSAVTGLPRVPLPRVIAAEDVRALDDDA